MKVSVLGASGYTGAQLVNYLDKHPKFDLETCYVSENSQDSGKKIQDLYPSLSLKKSYTLTPAGDSSIAQIATQNDAVFLALPHEVSHLWANEFIAGGCKVFDLSGAYRISNLDIFEKAYGFGHQYPQLITKAAYGLAEFNCEAIATADLIAVPGCYPTASLCAIKPIADAGLLRQGNMPVINATSGVSGAGRKASLTSSFCEVSLNAYGVLSHRHTPEISEHAGHEVIFTPHLGNFKRGILATITMFLSSDATQQKIDDAFNQAYAMEGLVKLVSGWPKVGDVQYTPFCHLHYKFDAETGCLIVCSAIDNLLKGAATQAIQCANIRFGLSNTEGLV
ncbi:N-acetyl-gamma-glutamyl-phosphate reductase [Glaciecola sp. 1036]|uniref:N-acetyl-gamma-glutamyl-phosphate reductase n=1 Tax=Alteromonadaceae TaxID=72275 RepID=UPI003CFEA63C